MTPQTTNGFVGKTLETSRLYKSAYDRMIGNTTPCARCANLISNGILLAVFVIGALGTSSILPLHVVGWTIVALGGSYIVVKLLAKDLKTRKVDLVTSAIIAAAIMTVGALGAFNVLSRTQLGFALMGGVVLTIFVTSYLMLFAGKQEEKAKTSQIQK